MKQYHFISIILAKTGNLDDGKYGQGYENLILAGWWEVKGNGQSRSHHSKYDYFYL